MAAIARKRYNLGARGHTLFRCYYNLKHKSSGDCRTKEHLAITPLSTSFRKALPQIAAVILIVGILFFIWQGGSRSSYNWQWFRIPKLLLPGFRGEEWTWGPLASGLRLTFIMALLSMPLAAVIGLAAALMEKSQLISARWISRSYVELVRNTPLLVQLYLLYFMMANLLNLDRTAAGIIALALFEGAFAAEIFRAGIEAVPRGMRDAALGLGLRPIQAFRLIYLPHSLPLILPPLANLFVQLIKHSSIVSVVALPELTDIARNIVADSYLTFEIWIVVAAIYISLCFGLSMAIRLWEGRILTRRRGTLKNT